jgi:undecaprenyl-diphosphatase
MWDTNIFLALNHDGGAVWDEFWWIVTGKLTWVPLYVLIIIMLWRQMGWRRMLVAVALIGLGVGAADLVAGLFKSDAPTALFADFVPRLRPSRDPALEGLVHTVHGHRGGMYGTVSAHAATAAVVALISASLLRRRWFTALMCTWAALYCFSRIYAGLHFPQDILLGLALGTLVGWIMVMIFRRLAKLVK